MSYEEHINERQNNGSSKLIMILLITEKYFQHKQRWKVKISDDKILTIL